MDGWINRLIETVFPVTFITSVYSNINGGLFMHTVAGHVLLSRSLTNKFHLRSADEVAGEDLNTSKLAGAFYVSLFALRDVQSG